MMATQPASAPALVWVCACGQAYRMAATGDGVRFWPSTDAAAYSRGGLTAEAPCVSCGDRIRGGTSGDRRDAGHLVNRPGLKRHPAQQVSEDEECVAGRDPFGDLLSGFWIGSVIVYSPFFSLPASLASLASADSSCSTPCRFSWHSTHCVLPATRSSIGS